MNVASRRRRRIHLTLRLQIAAWMLVLLAIAVVVLALVINVGTQLTSANYTRNVSCALHFPQAISGGSRTTLTIHLTASNSCYGTTLLPSNNRVGTRLSIAVDGLSHLRTYSTIGLGVVLILGTLGAYLFAGRALRPVRDVVRVAREVYAERLDTRLPDADSADEIGELKRALNAMFERLQQGFAREVAFVADASHELRTPLTALRANLELVQHGSEVSVDEYARTVKNSQVSLERLESLVSDLLILAGQAAEMPAASVLSLVTLVEDVVDERSGLATASDVTVSMEYDSDVLVRGEALHLRRAFENLLDNAVRYNCRQGRVDVAVKREGELAQVFVRDTGIGMSETEQRHVFERFWRGDSARSTAGSGLGLSLVAGIIARHGGSVGVVSVPGQGSEFQVCLPCVDEPNLGKI